MGGFKGNLIFSQPCAFFLLGWLGRRFYVGRLADSGVAGPRRAAIIVSGTTHSSFDNHACLFSSLLNHQEYLVIKSPSMEEQGSWHSFLVSGRPLLHIFNGIGPGLRFVVSRIGGFQSGERRANSYRCTKEAINTVCSR